MVYLAFIQKKYKEALTMEKQLNQLIRSRNIEEKKAEIKVRGKTRIVIPIGRDAYQEMMSGSIEFRSGLDKIINAYPEIFPNEIQKGYKLHGPLPQSKKMPDVRMRRIRVMSNDGKKEDAYTICPSFVMPYMTGYTDDVEKALFLRKFDVPT